MTDDEKEKLLSAIRHPSSSLRARVALITGASRGIGAAVAKRFAQEGAHVILIARDSKGLEATDDAIRAVGGTATLVPLDLTEPTQIEQLALQIAQRFGRLDILVGNAAILSDMTPLPHIAPADWDKVMTTNVTANWHLIRVFDALLKQSDAGRAMFVTSGVTTRPCPYWGAYAISKAALESMVNIYAAENTKTSLKINLIDPGGVRTRMRAQAFPGEDPLSLPDADAITDVFVKLARADMKETGKKFFARQEK
jgi:NAD(P)-dependent dehydrogenase (short-subunit alcohol dehydrogenase family)